jgi:hypothetical protein
VKSTSLYFKLYNSYFPNLVFLKPVLSTSKTCHVLVWTIVFSFFLLVGLTTVCREKNMRYKIIKIKLKIRKYSVDGVVALI